MPAPDDRFEKLITHLQKMKQSFRGSAKAAGEAGLPHTNYANGLVADVIGDVIRFAAELQVGDGSREEMLERKGVAAIIFLQRVEGIVESEEKALAGWRSLTENERRLTMAAFTSLAAGALK